MGLVLVDVDGTLLDGRSSEQRFIAHLLASGRLGPLQLASALAFFPRWASTYGADTAKKNKAYLRNLEAAEVAALAETFVERRLVSDLRPVLLRRLEEHRHAGDRIALLTGTPDFIAIPLARFVEAEFCRATLCRQRNGLFLAEPPEAHPFAADKVVYARKLCASLDMALADCAAYADSMHDLPLLRLVARPVAVHPDRALARIARRKGWEILFGPRGSAGYGLADRPVGEEKA